MYNSYIRQAITLTENKENEIKAIFSQPSNVLEAAAKRSGLILTFASPDHNGQVQIIPGPFISAAVGDSNTLMRLIGALADDGQDCLISFN